MTEFTTKLRNSTAFLSLAIMLQSCSGNGGLLLLMPDEVTNYGTFLWAALSFPIVCSLTTAVISLLLSRLFMGSNAKLALTLFYILFFLIPIVLVMFLPYGVGMKIFLVIATIVFSCPRKLRSRVRY